MEKVAAAVECGTAPVTTAANRKRNGKGKSDPDAPRRKRGRPRKYDAFSLDAHGNSVAPPNRSDSSGVGAGGSNVTGVPVGISVVPNGVGGYLHNGNHVADPNNANSFYVGSHPMYLPHQQQHPMQHSALSQQALAYHQASQ